MISAAAAIACPNAAIYQRRTRDPEFTKAMDVTSHATWQAKPKG
ncbi:hypothetical protein [Streptomyces carpinensis]|uniref:Uncharacterized protein n=1 Tax=Streptomyces carpinensis TaxID=66369 RepID=A0ABV1W1C9_9ACTN|nr:hypothetical protein [Streptomyces carpinensis]